MLEWPFKFKTASAPTDISIIKVETLTPEIVALSLAQAFSIFGLSSFVPTALISPKEVTSPAFVLISSMRFLALTTLSVQFSDVRPPDKISTYSASTSFR